MRGGKSPSVKSERTVHHWTIYDPLSRLANGRTANFVLQLYGGVLERSLEDAAVDTLDRLNNYRHSNELDTLGSRTTCRPCSSSSRRPQQGGPLFSSNRAFVAVFRHRATLTSDLFDLKVHTCRSPATEYRCTKFVCWYSSSDVT